MLLLLKTNDLLRSIESSLQTLNSSSSFNYLTRCCISLIKNRERELKLLETNQVKVNISNMIELIPFYIKSYINEDVSLLKIYLYELFLYIFNI